MAIPKGITIRINSTFDPKGLSVAEKRLAKFGSAANKVLLGLAGSAVVFAKAAAEDDLAATKLATTLQNVTGATSKTVAQTERYITKLALATGVADDQLRPSLDRLVRATGSVTEAQKLQALALDISAGTGKDLSAVTEALGKAQEGNFTSLSRLGAGIDKATISSGDLDVITQKLSKTFAGQADKAANTAAGRFARLQVSLQETQEEIGYALLPILEKLTPQIVKLAKFVNKNTDAIVIFAAVLGTLAIAVKAVQAATILYNGVMLIMEANSKRAAAGQVALNLALLANPVVLIVAGVIALVAAFVLAYRNSETFRKGVDRAFEWVKNAAGSLLEFFKKIPEFFINTAKTLANVITTPYRLAFAAIAKIWNNTIGKLSFTFPDWIPGLGGKSFQAPRLPEGIPALANGGIVTRPTLALIGEAGPEAVVPLSGKNTPGQNINITVNGAIDPEGVARSIEKILRTSKLRGGAYA
jgi:hypothetical protein